MCIIRLVVAFFNLIGELQKSFHTKLCSLPPNVQALTWRMQERFWLQNHIDHSVFTGITKFRISRLRTMLWAQKKYHTYPSSLQRTRMLSWNFHKKNFTHWFVSDTLMGMLTSKVYLLTFREYNGHGCTWSFCGQVKDRISFIFKLWIH